jgi:hypothetical protein
VGYGARGESRDGSIKGADTVKQRAKISGAGDAGRWLLWAVIGGAACGGGEPLPEPARIEMVAATNGQTAPAGARLPAALAAIVQSSDGVTVPRARVRWTVSQGAGAVLSDSVTVSDGNGRAEVSLVLGPAAGEHRVTATLVAATDASVQFTATATAPPSLASVTPTTFGGGDTLALAGANLSSTADVEIGGAPAAVVSGNATALTVIAPVCLPAGAVSVRALVAGAPSNALNATYQASAGPLALAVGQYASIDPAQLGSCATFPNAGPAGAEYLLAPQSVSTNLGVSASYRMQGNSVVVSVRAAPRVVPEPTLAMRFHDLLRAQEREAARLPRAPLASALSAGGTPPSVQVIDVGDRRAFEVCEELPCSSPSHFTTVNGEAQYVGTHAAIFTDDAAPAAFTPADYDSLGALFDQQLYEVDTQAFGSESDVDENGVVIILFTAAVNRLTPESQCATSIITGYFFGVDIDPAFQSDSRSNHGEVFYALAPDPQGTVTCQLSTDLVLRLVPVTFVHEFQHMINYHQHVLVRAADSEVLWLNEALSHLAEELAGLRFADQGNDVLFSRFALGDLYNAYIYLQDPGTQFLLPTEGTGTLEERGAGWLFLRWLVDQYGDDAIRRLVETSRTGTDNVTAVAGAPFAQLASQWFLANYVSDLSVPGFTAPSRLQYSTWAFRTTYQSLHDQLASRFPDPFPIAPAPFGNTFSASGTLRAGSGEYFLVQLGANENGFTVTVDDGAGGPVSSTVVPRLNVIRIR